MLSNELFSVLKIVIKEIHGKIIKWFRLFSIRTVYLKNFALYKINQNESKLLLASQPRKERNCFKHTLLLHYWLKFQLTLRKHVLCSVSTTRHVGIDLFHFLASGAGTSILPSASPYDLSTKIIIANFTVSANHSTWCNLEFAVPKTTPFWYHI